MRKKSNRYRSDKTKRNKTLRIWIKAIVGACTLVFGVVLLSGALARAYHLLLEAPWLRVEEVHVVGLKHMERREVLNALGVPRNANALTIKLSRLAANLNSLPWLQSSVVRLDLPGRLVVEVTEREPMAVIFAEDCFLLDTEGKLFLKTTLESSPDLLVVTGFSGMGLHEGSTLPAEPLEALKGLMATLQKAGNWLPLKQLSECRWQGEEGFVLVTAQKNVPIRLGSEDFNEKLDRLRRVYSLLGDRQWLDVVTRIDLDYPNRAYVEGHFPRPKTPSAS